MTVFFDDPFSDFMKDVRGEDQALLFSNLVYISWALKPLFGYLGDRFFPFRYRIKGYAISLGLINIAISFVSLIFVHRVKYYNWSIIPLVVMIFIIYMNQAFIDAITRNLHLSNSLEGMTSMTAGFEARAKTLRHERKPRSLIHHYVWFLFAKDLSRFLFYICGTFISDATSDFTLRMKFSLLVFGTISIGFVVLNFLFFNELHV